VIVNMLDAYSFVAYRPNHEQQQRKPIKNLSEIASLEHFNHTELVDSTKATSIVYRISQQEEVSDPFASSETRTAQR